MGRNTGSTRWLARHRTGTDDTGARRRAVEGSRTAAVVDRHPVRRTAALVAVMALVVAGSPPAAAQRGDAAVGACGARLADRDTVTLRRVREHVDVPASAPTGAGVGVAVVDTGISAVAGLQEAAIVAGTDLSSDASVRGPRSRDGYGHGTYLAEIIAGRGSASGRGIAPDAHLVDVKVGAGDGAVDVRRVIAGIDWVVEHRDRYGIRVLNLSFGTAAEHSPLVDPLSRAIGRAWRAGIVVVVAAGNDGRDARGLADPATHPLVIAVGATTRSNRAVAPWSSTGDGVRGPDLVAPGEGVLGAGAPGSHLATAHPDATCTDGDGTLYLRGSGTSQAAAAVSGAAAVLLEQRPHLTPDQVKHLLTSTAVPLGRTAPQVGRGRLDVGEALAARTPGAAVAQGRVPAAGVAAFDPVGGTARGHGWSGATWSGATWSGATWSGATWS